MRVRLPLSPSSAYAARRSAADALVEMGRADLRDGVALIASELVANAVMHAHTDMTLSVELAGNGVRVAVTDGSDVMPRWTMASETATSGRGLLLVRQLSRSWGVEPLPGGGKCVWAEVDETSVEDDSSSPDDLLELWADEPWPAPPPLPAAPDALIEVSLEIDVQAMLDSRAHTDDLVRDLQLTLIESEDPETASRPSDAVLALARRLDAANDEFREPRRQMFNQTVAAARRRQERATLRLLLQRNDVDAARRWLEALDEADALTAAGVLLVPPFPPALVEFRRSYIADLIERVNNAP